MLAAVCRFGTGGADAAESGPITDAGPADFLPAPLFMGGKLVRKGVTRIFSRRRSSVGEMPGSRSVRPPEACSQGKQGGKYERTVRPGLSGRLWTEGDRSIASLAMQSGLAGLIPIVSCGPQSAVIPLPTGRRPYTGRPRTGRTSRRSCVRVVRSRPCGAYRPRPERRRLPRSFRAGAARGPTSE